MLLLAGLFWYLEGEECKERPGTTTGSMTKILPRITQRRGLNITAARGLKNLVFNTTLSTNYAFKSL